MSVTAAELHLARCHDCGLLSREPPLPPGASAHCPRCDAALHLRKPASLARTWALLLAAYIMYIPANVLPVSTIISFGQAESDTILSGVIALYPHDPPVALLLAFASICVPLLKLLLMTWLAWSAQVGSGWRPRDRTVLYRVVEGIGRWSMLDIFVISLLAALVRLDQLMTIEAGPGAVAFCAVVVLTMFAAMAFDPRLIWDAAGGRAREEHR